jgi:hypothetical protein
MNVKRTIAGAADNIASLSNTLQQLVLGGEDPGGFFGICVSSMGHSETLSVFPSLIQPLASVDPSQHSTLIAIYVEYFSKVRDYYGIQLPACVFACHRPEFFSPRYKLYYKLLLLRQSTLICKCLRVVMRVRAHQPSTQHSKKM